MADALVAHLRKLRDNRTKMINGLEVRRDGCRFVIEDVTYDEAGAITKLVQAKAQTVRGLDYETLAFFLVEQATNRKLSTHRCRDRRDHLRLLQIALERNCHLYYGTVVHRDGRYLVYPPLIVDFDSVPELPKEKFMATAFVCPHCDKKMSSASGRTLHIKNKHGTIAKQSVPAAKEAPKPKETPQGSEPSSLKCPYCEKISTSAPGRTLHVKSKHPEKFADYSKK